MKKKMRRLPRQLKYPGRYKDFIVAIELVSRETLEELCAGSDAYWDDHRAQYDTKLDGRILICKDLDLEEQWDVLWHERRHALIDIEAKDEEDEG